MTREGRRMAACSQLANRAVWPMGLRVSLPCGTTSQAPSPSSQLPKCSTSTQRIILAVSQVRANVLRRCPPWTVWNASRTTLDSSGMASAVRSLADLVSNATSLSLLSDLFLFLFPTPFSAFFACTLPDYLRWFIGRRLEIKQCCWLLNYWLWCKFEFSGPLYWFLLSNKNKASHKARKSKLIISLSSFYSNILTSCA